MRWDWWIVSLSLSQAWTVDVQADRFDYGWHTEDNKVKVIPPNTDSDKRFRELCEGQTGVLRCNSRTGVIRLSSHRQIQFGRDVSRADWEESTRCGSAAPIAPGDANCTTVSAKRLLSHCSGQAVCRIRLTGTFHGQEDPCPIVTNQDGSKGPRKYLKFRFRCLDSMEDDLSDETDGGKVARSSNYSDRVIFPDDDYYEDVSSWRKITKNKEKDDQDMLPSANMSIYMDTIEKDYEDIVTKIRESGEITDALTANVSDYLESMMKSVKIQSRFFHSIPVSTLNITDRISSELMNLLDNQEKESVLEIKTSQMTLKLVKSKWEKGEEASVKWLDREKSVFLPHQPEIVRGDSENIEISLASYNNLKGEFESASDVISVSVRKLTSQPLNLSKPVIFLLPNNGTQNVSCAYWSFLSEHWAKDGCITVCHNSTHTKCSCSHLTNFALIFNVHEDFIADKGVHSTSLAYITYIGFSISILCMILTVLVFFFHSGSPTTTERDVIHVNLCLSLLTAEVVFLFGIERTQDAYICMSIAIILHYFFLCSFAWMFMEGYQIYVMLVKVFDSGKSSSKFNFILGYGLPFLIVLASFVIDHIRWAPTPEERTDMCWTGSKFSSYGTQQHCWLRVDNHFIFSFIVPAVTVIFLNLCFLLFAVYSMLVHRTGPNQTSSQRSQTRKLLIKYMKGVGVLMCLLGSTWISGILYLLINSIYLAYTFTILNSLQGVGIFVFQCLLNPAIKSSLRRRVVYVIESAGLSAGPIGDRAYRLTRHSAQPQDQAALKEINQKVKKIVVSEAKSSTTTETGYNKPDVAAKEEASEAIFPHEKDSCNEKFYQSQEELSKGHRIAEIQQSTNDAPLARVKGDAGEITKPCNRSPKESLDLSSAKDEETVIATTKVNVEKCANEVNAQFDAPEPGSNETFRNAEYGTTSSVIH